MSEPFWSALGSPVGVGQVDYEGAWSAGTAYLPGDVVTYNGVTYLAVNPSTGVTPAGGLAGLDIGLALPASPVDGQEFILTDSLTAPTFAWKLRYMAGKASNKWLFVGGSSAFSQVLTNEQSAGSSYAALTTAGPSITVPVAGQYEIGIGYFGTPRTAAQVGRMSYDIGGTAASDNDACGYDNVDFKIGAVSIFAVKTFTAVALVAKYKASAATYQYERRWMKLTPIAVGG